MAIRTVLARAILGIWALSCLGAGPANAVTIERVVGETGVEAWLIHDTMVPIISLHLAFRNGGASLDPAGRDGLATMVAGLLDEGAGPLTSQQFQGRLEDLAARLRFEAGLDHLTGGLTTLSAKRDEAFDLLRLALTQPRFDAEPVERIRGQLVANLAQLSQDPDYDAARAWFQLAYADHPYARPVRGLPETVAKIKTPELKHYVAQHIARDNLVVAVVGDITADQLRPLLDKTFGALPAKAAPAEIAETKADAGGTIKVIRKPIPQSVVVFGQEGLKRADPDWYAAYVMNYILGGGGFVSRLTSEVREKRGLAYGVYSYLQPFDHDGIVMGSVATRNDRVADSLQVIREEWRRIADKGVTADELANAKTYLTGSWPLRLDSTTDIAGLLLAIQLDHLGIDYMDRRNALIEAVTLEDANRAAARLIKPDSLAVVVVGAPTGLEEGR